MKGYALSILICFCTLSLVAQEDGQISSSIDTTSFAFGNVMYEQGNYTSAAQVYAALIDADGPSATLYYNLGNCYFRLQKTAPAILAYERALLMDPGNEDIEYNLELANRRTRDEIEAKPDALFRIGWLHFITGMHAKAWGILAIFLFWLAGAGWIIYTMPKFRKWQRQGFFVALIGVVIGLICLLASLSRSAYDTRNTYGIVMSPSTIIKSEPSVNSTNLALIHEGFKLEIRKRENEWTEIRMPDGVVGWVYNSDFEAIDPFIQDKY